MNKKIRYLLLLFQVILIITGCSKTTNNQESNQNGTNQLNFDTTIETEDVVLEDSKLIDKNDVDLLDESSNTDDLLKIHFIDVGQADSILIQIGENACLIDAGNNEDSDLVVSYLRNAGIKKLDYIIGTHPHEDHIGGLDAVINEFEIDKVLLPDYTVTTKTFLDVIDAIEANKLKITAPKLGDEYKIGDASFTIIAPVKSDYGDNPNNYSIGIKLVYGKTSFISVGDAEIEVEKDILATGFDLTADLFKVNHHGSHTSNSDGFLSAIDPTFAIISVGEGNSYGHPNSNVVTSLIEDDVQVYRTDKQGTIIATSDGINFSFKSNSKTSETDNKSGTSGSINNNTNEVKDKSDNSEEKDELLNKRIVYTTKTGSKYHISSCRFLKNSKIEIELSEAIKEGLSPCSECNP